MNKQEYRKAMNKIKWAGRQRGEKWGKKEMLIAQEMVMMKLKPSTPIPEGSGSSISQEKSAIQSLSNLLVDLGKIIRAK